MALVGRVVATANRPSTELLSLRPTVTLYRIHVRQFADRTHSWCVLRRYSEFVRLRKALARSVRTELPELPPKLVLHNSEHLADRYLLLDAFLRALLSLPAAAAHVHLRSFLGANDGASSAPLLSTSSPSRAVVEDDWEHESEASSSSEPAELPPHCWLLTGGWTADEERSRDSLEPMYKAMGTPPPTRRLLRGVPITLKLTHEPSARLVEVMSSSLGEGRTLTLTLAPSP